MVETNYVAIANTHLNGARIKRVTCEDNLMTVHLSGTQASHKVPQAEESYVTAYMMAHGFFQIGNHHYNPALQVDLYVETVQGVETGHVVDSDGDIMKITEAKEIQALRDAVAARTWQQPPP